MTRLDRILCLLAALWVAMPGHAANNPAQAELRAMRKEALALLYDKRPQAKQEIRAAAGYGVFQIVGAQVLILGGSGGTGVVRDNLTGRDTFMRAGSVSAGLGIGYKDTRLVLIFKHRDILKRFMDEGWVFSGEANAVAKSEGEGKGTRDATDPLGIQVYQMTQNGLMAQGTLQGTKYWKDEELNGKP